MSAVRVKICTGCGKRKKIEHFFKRSDKAGYRSKCKDCFMDGQREYRKHYKPAPVEKTKLRDVFLGY